MIEKNIAFIAGNSLSDCSGGVSGVNYHCFTALQRKINVEYVHVALPPPILREVYFSKLQKALHLPRKYFAFSPKRLAHIAATIDDALQDISADMLFFSGFTPWCKYTPRIPYVAYNDICFLTYVDFYNKRNEFSIRDLQRIMDAEAQWLCNAFCVFFMSEWSMELTKRDYNLDGKNFKVVSRGGAIPIPAADTYQGKHALLFISREFVPKGGLICFEIFKRLRSNYPDCTLDIIGEKPPQEIIDFSGVHYHGWLHKNVPAEFQRFQEIISQAMFLIHPTFKDTNPLVISEAGYYGCPSISVRKFAIPELIADGEDGLLLDIPVDIGAAVKRIEFYFENSNQYLKFRKNARNNHCKKCNWDHVADQMLSIIQKQPEKILNTEIR